MEKLKSRKFWITIIVIAAAIIYGIRSMGVEDNAILSGICVACACVAGVAYVIAEAMVDDDKILAKVDEVEEEIVEEEIEEGEQG